MIPVLLQQLQGLAQLRVTDRFIVFEQDRIPDQAPYQSPPALRCMQQAPLVKRCLLRGHLKVGTGDGGGVRHDRAVGKIGVYSAGLT